MQKRTIVILQDNALRVEELKVAFSNAEEFAVVGTATDGEEGVNLILKLSPEYCIIDLILNNLDGLGVLERLKSAGCNSKIIVFSALGREEVIETCLSKGAAYYITKPCPPDVLVKRVKDLFLSPSVDKKRVEVSNVPKQLSLDEKISRIFISVGIPPHIKGYSYLREGIKLAVESPDVINNITKKLYPMIGEKYATTPSKVERAIRHAIEVAWARGRINNINDLFGVQTYLTGEKPTNGEFIALIADKMLLEGA
ncbi:MAG: sporulation transcription factor Spo0A [Clostridia bacterium]|nr:sporulation transcription factor Spo0A [Clostridia bacterium]MBR1675940.1 sporulation transcription factor Spo0A [Clostridia bacterium]